MLNGELNKNSQNNIVLVEESSGEEFLMRLLSVSHKMAGMRSVDPLLSYITDEVVALVGAERGYIVLINDDGSLNFKVRRHVDGSNIRFDVDAISRSVLDEVIRTQESVVVRNALMDPTFGDAMSVMNMQLRSIMCSPLIVQNRIIGAIYVENRSQSGRFVKKDAVPLEFFSNHAAVAIENAYLNENLETLVEERTSALVAAKDDAEAAARAKSVFLSTMTHELRTPMNGVLGMTSLLMDTPLNEEQQELIDTIRISGDTLLTLISDILDFSKIEAKKIELDPVAFRLESCIEQAMFLVMATAAGKRLHLAYTIDEDVPLNLVQDITRIRQILTNLLGNAVKFTDQGQVAVHVSLADSPALIAPDERGVNERRIKFTVADTGIGIPDERISRLFQPFSQAESSTNRHYGGTGLGLVICKRLCELMGGKIEVESEVGVGTSFSFFINAKVNPASEDLPYDLLAGKRILLITSSNLMQRSVKQSLRNYQVTLTNRTTITTSVFELNFFDAVIIDATVSVATVTADREDNSVLEQKDTSSENRREIVHENAISGTDKVAPISTEWRSNLATIGKIKPIILLTHWGDRIPSIQSQYPMASIPIPIKSAQLRNELATVMGSKMEVKPNQENPVIFDGTMSGRFPLRILLAEDNIINQKVALRMLERFGYQADLVENGVEAVEALRERAYDVILMDVQMPRMDGLEATRIIRAEIPADRQPYIVAMTANATSDSRAKYLKANMNEYLSKPVSVKELQAILKLATLRETDKIS